MKGRRRNADSGHVIETEPMSGLGDMIARMSIRRDAMMIATDLTREVVMTVIDRIPEAATTATGLIREVIIATGRTPEEEEIETDRTREGRTTATTEIGMGIVENARLPGAAGTTIDLAVLLLMIRGPHHHPPPHPPSPSATLLPLLRRRNPPLHQSQRQ